MQVQVSGGATLHSKQPLSKHSLAQAWSICLVGQTPVQVSQGAPPPLPLLPEAPEAPEAPEEPPLPSGVQLFPEGTNPLSQTKAQNPLELQVEVPLGGGAQGAQVVDFQQPVEGVFPTHNPLHR